MIPKTKLLLVFIIIIVAIGIWLWQGGEFLQNQELDYQTTEFSGAIVSVEGETLVLIGGDVVEGRDELLNQENAREVRASIAPDTQLLKTTVFLPSDEELEATDGVYMASDLRREEGTGSIEDLISQGEGFGIAIKAAENIAGKNSFTAETVEYIILALP